MTTQPTAHSRQLTAPPTTPATEADGGAGSPRPGSVAPPERSNRSLTLAGAGAAVALALAVAAGAETVRVTAEEAAARAVEVSHAVAAADARVAAANETVKSADASTLPSVSLGAAVAHRSSVPEFKVPVNNPPLPPTFLVIFPDITMTYGASLQLQQALYAGGAIDGQRSAMRSDARVSAAGRAASVADLRLAAKLAYWEAVRSSASVEVARAEEERAGRLLDDTKALFAAGMAVRADTLAAEERVASAHVQLIVARARADNALAELRSLLHLDPGDDVELAASLAGPLPAQPADAKELQAAALASRPELAASAAQIEALRSLEQVAAAPARPLVAAVAQVDYSRPNQRFVPPTDQWQTSWAVGLQATWSLFDGGKAQSDTTTVRFNERAAAQDREELTRRVLLDVENARRNVESALAAVEAADAARALAVEREKEATERHAAGLAPMVDILDAQSQLAAAEQQSVNARAGSWQAAAALERAVGP